MEEKVYKLINTIMLFNKKQLKKVTQQQSSI